MRVPICLVVALALATGCSPANYPAGVNLARGAKRILPTTRSAPGEPSSSPAPARAPGGAAGASALTGSLVGQVRVPAGVVANNGAGLIGDKGAGVVANNSGTLVSKIKLVANNGSSLVSNNGAGVVANNSGSLVSNNGSNLVSNNGSSLGAGATSFDQLPLAGASVRVYSAAGRPVKGTDGQPLVARTDANGNYAFVDPLPDRGLVLKVELDNQLGTLEAIVPKDGVGQRQALVDAVSTLTSAYILGQYVAPQADPDTVLDKLPAAVETQTRAKAASALARGEALSIGAFEPQQLAQAVTALRQRDGAFDGQMETVKKLLVAAGLLDAGVGQPATSVAFRTIDNLVVAPNGQIYFHETQGGVYRVDGQGMLQRVTASSGTTPAGSLEGLVASKTYLGDVRRIGVDDQNRCWLMQPAPITAGVGFAYRLWRVEADGTLHDAARGVANLHAFVPTGGEGFRGTSYAKWGDPVVLWDADAGHEPRQVASFSGSDTRAVANDDYMGFDRQGRTLFGPSFTPPALRYDPAKGALETLAAPTHPIDSLVSIDAAGRVFYNDLDAKVVKVIDTSGQTSTVPMLDRLPFTSGAIAGAGDGSYYLLADAAIVRLTAQGRTVVAGKTGTSAGAGSQPTATALQHPVGLAVKRDGTLVVVDAGTVLQIDPHAGTTTLVAKDGLKDAAGTGLLPAAPQIGPDGSLYLIGQTDDLLQASATLFRLDAQAGPQRLATIPGRVHSWLIAADGTITLGVVRHVDLSHFPASVLQRTPDGQIKPLLDESLGLSSTIELAMPADGQMLVASWRQDAPGVWRATATGGLEALSPDTFVPDAFDASGRGYRGVHRPDIEHALSRFDPTSQKTEVLVGPGGRFFTGSGADDSAPHPLGPCFDGQGNLYFLDPDNKQVKRIPADQL